MSGVVGPRFRIVQDGLVLNLDAGNTSSYPGTGTDWFDLTSNNNDGVLTNGASYVTDGGGSISFDGVNDFVNLSTPIATNSGTNNSSINVWVKTGADTSTNQTIYSERDGTTHIFSKIRINSNEFDYIFLTPTYTLVLSTNTGSLSTNTWYNVCGTKDGDIFKIYVNGVLSNSITLDIGSFSVGGTISSYIGRETIGLYLDGNVGVQQIYSKTLIDSEVLQNYNALKSRFGL